MVRLVLLLEKREMKFEQLLHLLLAGVSGAGWDLEVLHRKRGAVGTKAMFGRRSHDLVVGVDGGSNEFTNLVCSGVVLAHNITANAVAKGVCRE